MTEPPFAMLIASLPSSSVRFVSVNPSRIASASSETNTSAEKTGSAQHASRPAAEVILSQAAQDALAAGRTESVSEDSTPNNAKSLTREEERQVAELKKRDAEVRAHERAHVAAAGGLVRGGIQYETQRGPDNKEYAVGGHVNIDTSTIEGDPRQTIQKAQQVRRAALAPANPSTADRQVAAKATRTIRDAQTKLAQESTTLAPKSADGTRELTPLAQKSNAVPQESHTASAIRDRFAADYSQPVRPSYARTAYSASAF